MSAVHAIENAFGVKVDGQLRALRRLIYCGEWIESHALHVVMLHAPDFLGFPDAIQMAREHGDAVRNGLALKKAGNELMRVLGGREIHPVNVKAGGFYRVPTRAELAPVAEKPQARPRAGDRARALGRDVSRSRISSATTSSSRCAIRTNIRSTRGGSSPIATSTSTSPITRPSSRNGMSRIRPRCIRRLKRRGAYLVGPLARYALNFDRLPPSVQALAREAGLGPVCRNPFHSIIVRALEIVYACEEALRLIADYEPPERRGGADRAARRHRLRLHRGAARHLLAPLRIRRRGHDPHARASCRRPRRTSRASRPISPPWRPRSWISRTTSSAIAASRASATTIPASPAPPISSNCRCIAHERDNRSEGSAPQSPRGWAWQPRPRR